MCWRPWQGSEKPFAADLRRFTRIKTEAGEFAVCERGAREFMGLDLYVGPLTRYYLGDWETVVQRFGKESGMPVTIVRPASNQENKEPKLGPGEILDLVTKWRSALSEGLGENLQQPLDWPESANGEYFTDKPAWDGYGNLALLAAYDEHPGLLPPVVACSDFSSDPAWQASTHDDFRSRYTTILLPELWLPCRFAFTFRAADVTGSEVWIGSSITLLEQLTSLNANAVKASLEQLTQWRRENFEPGDTFEKASRFGLAMFIELAEKSVLHGLPMKMDY